MVESNPSILEDASYEKNCFIAKTTAEYRENLVSDVAYHVDLSLPKGDWYTGKVQITLTIKQKPTTDLFFDFRGIKIG